MARDFDPRRRRRARDDQRNWTVTLFRIRIAAALTVAALLAASFSSCAYFNTLYNARKQFREAEKGEVKGADERAQREKYDAVIQKCIQMIQDHPKSRWVDDAEFLMGRAYLKQGDYDKAIRKFQEILTNFPKSGYVPESLYWIAYAYHEKQEDTQALVFTDQFLKEYPKHKLRYDVMFLAGDVQSALKNDDAALGYYGMVADEAKNAQVIDRARLKVAELYRERGEWEKAAASYEKVLRKGLAWSERYNVSLALGESYVHIGKSREALLLYEGLLKQSTTAQETPPIMLGEAASYMGMDSVSRAVATYRAVASKYHNSVFSATAYYQLGMIYGDKLDSLQAAQEAFAKVGSEYANYEHAREALERSNSLRRLIELRKTGAGGATPDQEAEKRFMAAEIQLTRLDNVPVALQGYTAVLDSFPETTVAPRAAYAIGWVYERKLKDKEKAIEAFRTVAERYPRSPQAQGALSMLETLGAVELRDRMKAYVDSALADTLAAKPRSQEPAAPATVDTSRAAAPVAAPRSPADASRAPGTHAPPPRDTSRVPMPRMMPPPRSLIDTSRAPGTHAPPRDTSGAAMPDTTTVPRDTARAFPPGSGVVPPVHPDTSGAKKAGAG
jgi:TolA-binding protein